MRQDPRKGFEAGEKGRFKGKSVGQLFVARALEMYGHATKCMVAAKNASISPSIIGFTLNIS